MRLLLVPLLLLAAACGSSDGAGDSAVPGLSPGGDALGSSDRPANDLAITLDRGDGSPPDRYTLVCAGVAEGTHPSPEAACEQLERLDEPFAPLPADRFCTEQYGGPQTARVTGVWQGEPVDLQLSRTNGCFISQWDALGPLLPGPVGADVPE